MNLKLVRPTWLEGIVQSSGSTSCLWDLGSCPQSHQGSSIESTFLCHRPGNRPFGHRMSWLFNTQCTNYRSSFARGTSFNIDSPSGTTSSFERSWTLEYIATSERFSSVQDLMQLFRRWATLLHWLKKDYCPAKALRESVVCPGAVKNNDILLPAGKGRDASITCEKVSSMHTRSRGGGGKYERRQRNFYVDTLLTPWIRRIRTVRADEGIVFLSYHDI